MWHIFFSGGGTAYTKIDSIFSKKYFQLDKNQKMAHIHEITCNLTTRLRVEFTCPLSGTKEYVAMPLFRGICVTLAGVPSSHNLSTVTSPSVIINCPEGFTTSTCS